MNCSSVIEAAHALIILQQPRVTKAIGFSNLSALIYLFIGGLLQMIIVSGTMTSWGVYMDRINRDTNKRPNIQTSGPDLRLTLYCALEFTGSHVSLPVAQEVMCDGRKGTCKPDLVRVQ